MKSPQFEWEQYRDHLVALLPDGVGEMGPDGILTRVTDDELRGLIADARVAARESGADEDEAALAALRSVLL